MATSARITEYSTKLCAIGLQARQRNVTSEIVVASTVLRRFEVRFIDQFILFSCPQIAIMFGIDGLRKMELWLMASLSRLAQNRLLDLGAIGKGYAIERAAEVLREAGVASALLHGGTSTVYALGHPPEAEYWKVAVEQPPASFGAPPSLLPPVRLKDEAMSASAIWGRSFQVEGKTFGHIIDPRTGHPAGGAVLAAVVLPSATETDALSTALLILGADGQEKVASLRSGMRTILLQGVGERFRVENSPLCG